ncbi:MAG: hypothetical protein ABSA85_05180 [Terracidiphilus sp.]|jgi:hypothetical protein
MSLLQQEEHDDAARGEEYTKGTSHVLIAAIIAGLVMCVAIGIYAIVGQKPPFAAGEITAIWAHPQHTETSGFDANGAPMAKQEVDQVMVFVTVSLQNKTKNPLFLGNVTANVTLADGSIAHCYAANKGDYERIFVAYPNIPVPHNAPISPLDTTIDPGQTVVGTFVSAFKMKQQDWDSRKGLDFTFDFRYQAPLIVTPKVNITER